MKIKGICLAAILLIGFVSWASAEKDRIIDIKNTYFALTSAQQTSQNLVIRDKESWLEILRTASIKPDWEVDFQNEMVIASFLGERPSDGYEIKIYQVLRKDRKIEVKLSMATPVTGESTSQAKTSPFYLAVIEKSPLPVEFVGINKEITDLIKRLGDDDWQTREAATRELIRLGKPAVPCLLEAVHHPDPEVRLRTRLILEEIMVPILTPLGWVGITLRDVDPQDPRLVNQLPPGSDRGIEIIAVLPGYPSEKYGLKQGDILISLDGQALRSTSEMIKKVNTLKPGTTVKFTLIRGNNKMIIPLVLGQRPQEYLDQVDPEKSWLEWWEKNKDKFQEKK